MWLPGKRAARLAAIVVTLGVGILVTGAVQTRAAAPPRVTMIGDSAASALEYTQTARAILAEGVDLRLELAPCRRVGQSSCPYDGARPATVIDLVPMLGEALGQTVVVAVGYNDYEAEYAGDIEDALAALRKAGVTRVVWLTLHEARPAYAAMNDLIRAAASRHSELTIADWQLYSRSHPDWFQDDGIHLQRAGAEAMATLVHNTLVTLGIPAAAPTSARAPSRLQLVSSRLPEGQAGTNYSARLSARGGARPYRFARASGRLPVGLRLQSDGGISGVPSAPGTYVATVRVSDARRSTVSRRISLRIRASS